MGNITILIAAIAVCFILVYFFFKLGENKNDEAGEKKQNHFLLQILILALLMGSLLVIGKVALDDSQNCQFVNNATEEIYVYGTNLSGYHFDSYNLTLNPAQANLDPPILFHKSITNEYKYLCEDNPNNSAFVLYNILRWFVYATAIYIFVYIFYSIYINFVEPLVKNGFRLK